MIVDRKPLPATVVASRSVRWPPGGWARLVALTCVALACAAWVASGWGPAQAVGGTLLACYLPGRLALRALSRSGARPDPALEFVLAVALSLAATMLLGAVAAGFRLGFSGGRMALLAAALCVALGLAAGVRRQPAIPPAPARVPRRLSPWTAAAALPAIALSAVLAAQLIGYVRHRPSNSYYTELSVVMVDGEATVQVHSRERVAVDFRCEERLNGALLRQDRFTLRPGRSIRLPAYPTRAGPVEILLFRGTEPGVYRRLIL